MFPFGSTLFQIQRCISECPRHGGMPILYEIHLSGHWIEFRDSRLGWERPQRADMLPHKTTEGVSDMALFGLSKLFGGSQLRPVESRVITAVSSKLPSAARQLFDAQINQVNRIQRHPSGKEANFYTLRRGKPSLEERFLFPLRTETLLATVHLNLGQDKKPLRAEVWLVNGHVFSVDFNKTPGKPSENEIHVDNVEILRD